MQVQAISIFFLVKTSKIWRATKVFPQPAIPSKYTLCPLLTRSKIICCCSLRLQAALYKKEKKHPISDTKNSLHQLVFSKEKHDKVYNYIDNFINKIKRLLLKRTWQDRGEHISILTKRLTNLNLNTFACTLSCPMEYSYQLKKRKKYV